MKDYFRLIMHKQVNSLMSALYEARDNPELVDLIMECNNIEELYEHVYTLRDKKESLIAVLELLRDEPKFLRKDDCGICTNAMYAGCNDLLKEVIRKACEGWEHYSGDPDYPVKGGQAAYAESNGKWSSEYGKLRLELLERMLEVLRNES